jgi:hypothetical protein
MDNRASKIIFIHIPKTAGSTFISILRKVYNGDKIFLISGGSAVPSNYQYEVALLNFTRLDKKILDKVELLAGHMPVVINDKTSEFKFITFLRNPIERVVSDYKYITTNFGNPLHLLVNDISISDYVSRNEDLQLDNLQTRLISGKLEGEITCSDVEIARRVIKDHFAFVGFTEYFNISLIYFRDRLNWPKNLIFKKENITKKSNLIITDKDLTAIEKYNKFDMQLYNECLGPFLDEARNSKAYLDEELKSIRDERESKVYKIVKKLL